MISATPPFDRKMASRSLATASSRAGEVSTISPSRSNARPPAAIRDPPLDRRRHAGGSASASRNSLATSSNGRCGKLVDGFMPMRVGHRRLLSLAQHRAGLDEMHVAGKARRAHHPQRIAGQRSAARPKLGIDRVVRRPGALPAVGQRGADHLAEHLADFRRGREIAARAERIAGRVIISVAGLHIGFDA